MFLNHTSVPLVYNISNKTLGLYKRLFQRVIVRFKNNVNNVQKGGSLHGEDGKVGRKTSSSETMGIGRGVPGSVINGEGGSGRI